MKNQRLIFPFICIVLMIINSCNSGKQNVFNNNELYEIMKFISPLRMCDSTSLLKLTEKEEIIIHYFNGDCSSCIGGLVELEQFAKSFSESLSPGLLYIAHTEDTILLNYYLEKRNFKPAVLFDEHRAFYNWNKHMIDKGISTFLINNSGTLLLKENPLKNKDVELEYRNQINTNE